MPQYGHWRSTAENVANLVCGHSAAFQRSLIQVTGKRALAAQAAEGSRRCQLGVREDGSSPGGFVARDLVEESRASPPPAATPRPPATPAAPVLLVRRLSGTPGAGAGASPGWTV